MLELAVDPKKLIANAYTCFNCQWFRDYTPTAHWLESEIDHPQYGVIKERDLVIKDVQEHDCREHIMYLQSKREGL